MNLHAHQGFQSGTRLDVEEGLQAGPDSVILSVSKNKLREKVSRGRTEYQSCSRGAAAKPHAALARQRKGE